MLSTFIKKLGFGLIQEEEIKELIQKSKHIRKKADRKLNNMLEDLSKEDKCYLTYFVPIENCFTNKNKNENEIDIKDLQ